jgi:hypothetical protein
MDAGLEAMTRTIQEAIMGNLGQTVVMAVQTTLIPALEPMNTTIALLRAEVETQRVDAEAARQEDRQRLDALEQQFRNLQATVDARPSVSFPPPVQSGNDDRDRDILIDRDPWARSRPPQGASSSRGPGWLPPAPLGPPPVAPQARQAYDDDPSFARRGSRQRGLEGFDHPGLQNGGWQQRGHRQRDSEEFVARKVFIRGFAEIDDREGGIRQSECRALVSSLLARVPREYLTWLVAAPDDMHAPRFVNRQITLNLNDGAPLDAAQLLAKAISDACSGLDGNAAITWNNRKLWASRDRKLWEKVRNGNLFRARKELEKCLPGIVTYTDWAAGLLYIRQNEEDKLIGSWSAESDWTWKSERLLALVGQEKHDDLVDAMAPR